MNARFSWILGLCFIAGMTVCALLVGHTVRTVKRMEEYVTVKGLSEREVPADLAIWPITFVLAGNNLTQLQGQIQASRKAVYQFLGEAGFDGAEITNAPPQISDTQASGLLEVDEAKRGFRYRATITVLLRSTKVDKVKVAMETCDKLVEQGIALSDDRQGRTQFLFTGLNKIKPDMIQEANRNARKAAERFAADSEVPVGAVRHALQGTFEVNDVDSSSPDRKIVRVVTTVDFYLK